MRTEGVVEIWTSGIGSRQGTSVPGSPDVLFQHLDDIGLLDPELLENSEHQLLLFMAVHIMKILFANRYLPFNWNK
jgi:hypothetical protein